LPIVIDAMARRYHKLPSELLELDLVEFSLNSLIFMKGIEEEQRQYQKSNPMKEAHLSSFSLDIRKIKRGKK